MKQRRELKARRVASLCALSAAGVAAAGSQDADAAIILTTVNTDVGFGPTDSTIEILPLAGGLNFGFATTTFPLFSSRSLFIAGTVGANFQVKTQTSFGAPFALPLDAGFTFGTAPGGSTAFAYLAWVSTGGSVTGPGAFTDKYFAFSFVNGGTTLYGWVLGSLSITPDGPAYHITSYAYEDTGIMIATGQTLLVPEPAAISMSLLGAALVGGAAGVRRWKKAKADEAAA